MSFKINRSLISSHSICDYYYRPATSLEIPIVLLLHGYGETAKIIYDKLDKAIPSSWGVLCPNGPFPLPKKNHVEGTWNLNYAWYFFDSKTKKYFINQSYPQEILSHLIEKELKISNPLYIIGYSQGGYLAPFVGIKLENTVQSIAINAEYKHLLLPKKFNFVITSINGIDDQIVDPINAQNSHQIILGQGNQGEFFLMEETDHSINDRIIDKTKSLLETN